MARVYEVDGVVPVIHPAAFVHHDAVLIGDVIIGAGCYVGPGASLRGDMGRLVLEDGANVQDNCILHCFPGARTVVEKNAHIGHGAMLHGCTVKTDALVGMSAVIMDGAVIGEQAIVAAMAFVKAGFEVPPRSLVAGIPGKVIRELTDEEMAWKHEGTLEYQRLAERCLATLRPVEPLTRVEPDRPRLDAGEAKPLHAHRKR